MILINQHFDSLLRRYKCPLDIVITRDSSNAISISTECGKPMKHFPAAIASSRLTISEREYLTEGVLDPWMKKHHKNLTKYYNFIIDDVFGLLHDDLAVEISGVVGAKGDAWKVITRTNDYYIHSRIIVTYTKAGVQSPMAVSFEGLDAGKVVALFQSVDTPVADIEAFIHDHYWPAQRPIEILVTKYFKDRKALKVQEKALKKIMAGHCPS